MKIALVLMCCLVAVMVQSSEAFNVKTIAKCLVHRHRKLCVAKTLGLVDDNGKMDKGKIKSLVEDKVKDAGKVASIVTGCSIEKGTALATASNLIICLGQFGLPFLLL